MKKFRLFFVLGTISMLLTACGPKTTTETSSQTQQTQETKYQGLTQQVTLPQQVSFEPPSYRTISSSIPSKPETYTVQSPDGGKYKVTFNPVSSEVPAATATTATVYPSTSAQQNYVASASTNYAPTYSYHTSDQPFHGVSGVPAYSNDAPFHGVVFHGVVSSPSCPNPDIYSPPSCYTTTDQQFHGVR